VKLALALKAVVAVAEETGEVEVEVVGVVLGK
jgi:hypothetical protein